MPLDVSLFKRETHLDGIAPHFRIELGKWLKDLFDQEEYLKPNGEKYNIYQDGLKIYTTINPVYQRLAEEAAREHMVNVQKHILMFGVIRILGKKWKTIMTT